MSIIQERFSPGVAAQNSCTSVLFIVLIPLGSFFFKAKAFFKTNKDI
jgi:hypothetical protein